jgi:hypothetical protein
MATLTSNAVGCEAKHDDKVFKKGVHYYCFSEHITIQTDVITVYNNGPRWQALNAPPMTLT